MASKSSYNQVLLTEGLKGKSINALMSKVIFTADVQDTIKKVVDETMLRHAVSFIPVTKGNHLLGYIDNNVIMKIDVESRATTKVGDVYISSNAQNTVSPNFALNDLISKMSKTGHRKMLVADKGVLLGVITLADLMEYIALRSSLSPA